ncbi:MAG: hypothetical protein FJY95_22415 [Candidatus Handelsmanbacteria bacterium]|nr:hypothetical protein [Candidatus Handelsmanbacteria bacterium]
MESTPSSSIKWLRERLVQARRARDLKLLEQVEEGLHALGECRYRCCLLDYDRFEPSYYVRLLGYEQGRVRAEIEYPINPGLSQVQLLPLSHLADYHEARSWNDVRRIYAAIAPFIHQKAVPLAREARPRPADEQARYAEAELVSPVPNWTPARIGWFAAGGVVLAGIFLLLMLKAGH